mmetsp:Transcript_32738/g.76119  ORF Transcript_32738/g.76119 Transcript_32738/m.76119 type:complete len:389 (-) Transcript_32738:190-1356(-)
MKTAVIPSRLAERFDDLQGKAHDRRTQGTSPTAGSVQITSSTFNATRVSIGILKDFYLERLAKSEHGGGGGSGATLLGSKLNTVQIGATAPAKEASPASRPTFPPGATRDIEDIEVMCNNCFSLIKSSEASQCSGTPADCTLACRSGNSSAALAMGPLARQDLKLQRLRGALEARLQDKNVKLSIMRHLTQLRYHLDTALKWSQGCCDIGALTHHTILQVKQLTMTSRVLAPAVLVFSKRVESAIVQKERELRKSLMKETQPHRAADGRFEDSVFDQDELADSVADVNSVVSELDSDCGTHCNETIVTEGPSNDVGNMKDLQDDPALKSEDEQRRWFYSQCLTAKLACPDKARARKMLISEFYTKVKDEGVPVSQWVVWIHKQLNASL